LTIRRWIDLLENVRRLGRDSWIIRGLHERCQPFFETAKGEAFENVEDVG